MKMKRTLSPILLLVVLGLFNKNAEAFHKSSSPILQESNNKALLSVRSIPRGGAKKKAVATSTEGVSIPKEVFNLVKGIVGVGVLSLPAGT